MGVVASLTLYIRRGMRAGLPLVCGALMAGCAQVGVWFNWHLSCWVAGLEWTVTGLASHAFFNVRAALGVETGKSEAKRS